MFPTQNGSFRLFRFAGITVFLHWSWFVIAAIEVASRSNDYTSFKWNVAEYLALFCIVLMHEFGHSLACRQVGGRADQIILWPFGGVAYVDPPQRPGATLWSIAAGPLVNVILFPILVFLYVVSVNHNWGSTMPDVAVFIRTMTYINAMLLFFNLLPVFPLDGGQILRSLLWFFIGRSKSLQVTTIVGFVGVAGLIAFAVLSHSIWMFLISGFVLMNCWSGFQTARVLAHLERLPRHDGFTCPSCHAAPPVGALWRCGSCQTTFDPFVTGGQCPKCLTRYDTARCFDCGTSSPIAAWVHHEPPPIIIETK